MSIIAKIIIIVLGTIISLFWLYCVKNSVEVYDEQIEYLDPKEYFLPELCQIGYFILEKFNISLDSRFFAKRREKLVESKGENADFYLYANVAAQISYFITIVALGFLFAIIADSKEITFFSLILAGLIVYYLDYTIDESIDKRHDEILRDLPNVMSKLSLLINAGMILRDAWAKVANTGDRLLYQEMQIAEYDMSNGLSDYEALMNFTERCNVKEIKKFTSVIIQNIEKGSGELSKSLKELSEESWNEKKQLTIQKGAAADSKLMIPTGIIFAGILMVIMVPLFTNLF